MHNDNNEGDSTLLFKARKACKLISVIMKAILGVLCVWWAYTVVLMCNALINQSSLNNAESLSVSGLIIYVFHCLVVSCICIVLIKVFSDSAKGESPFTMIQVRRLRAISALLVAYPTVELAYSFNASFLNVDGAALGYGGTAVTLDIAPIIAAAVIFAFSFVFKYGVLLQEFSDETL